MPTANVCELSIPLAESIVPAWLALPLAAVLLFVLAVHLHALARSAMPASRKRIRIVNGLLMMLATPAAAYAFGVASTEDQRRFVLAWVLVGGLLLMVIFLALLDILNTSRLHLRERAELRRDLASARAALSEEMTKRQGTRTAHTDGNAA